MGDNNSDVIRESDATVHLDPTVPAGDDFYRHVNSQWLEANPIPPEYGSWGSFHEVHVRNEELIHGLLDAAATTPAEAGTPGRMVGDYWAAGLDEAAIESAGLDPLGPLLDLIATVAAASDLTSVLAELRRNGIGMVFGSYVSPDFEDSSQYLLYMVQGGLGLPERDYYFRDDEHSVTLRADYYTHISRMLELVGRDADPSASATAIIDLETRLAGFSYTPTELRDTELTTNKVDAGDFASALPDFGLADYLRQVAGDVPSQINLDNPEFFKNFGEILLDVPVATLQSYLRWNLIRATATSLSAPFVEASFDFYGRKLGGQREMKPRWKRVLGAASVDIGQQVSQLYVEAAFSAEAKQRCEAMVDRLLDAMRDSLEKLDWMGDATKRAALKKLDGFSYKIGYPDEWRDYSGLEIDRGAFITNRLRASQFEYNRKLSKLGKPVDKGEWAMEPHAVNAYYHPLYNEIVFPAGILQPPFFFPDADEATNFGAIGTVIGHEITHGFDDQGSKFDASGNLENWWTKEDRDAFDELTHGLAEQYGAYAALEGLNVNGELTLGENIADLGGVTIAFGALKAALADSGRQLNEPANDGSGLTFAQRFFVSYATIWRSNYTDEYVRLIVTSDPHSPNEFRCNGVLANFPEFVDAFALSADTPLAALAANPIKIW